MAFPSTSILDDFNRANEGPPPSASWTGTVVVGDGSFTVIGNAARLTNSTASSVWWSASNFGADQEVFGTMSLPSGGFLGLFLRLASPGTSGVDGYLVQADDTANSVGVFRLDNGVFTQLGSDITQTVAAGDGLGATIIDSTITVYYKSGAGSWTALTPTFTDSTYTAGGFIGIRAGNASPMDWDDFGGGTIASGPDPSFRIPILRPAIFSPGIAR